MMMNISHDVSALEGGSSDDKCTNTKCHILSYSNKCIKYRLILSHICLSITNISIFHIDIKTKIFLNSKCVCEIYNQHISTKLIQIYYISKETIVIPWETKMLLLWKRSNLARGDSLIFYSKESCLHVFVVFWWVAINTQLMNGKNDLFCYLFTSWFCRWVMPM